MPNKPDPKDIIWDESEITWDQPAAAPKATESAPLNLEKAVSNIPESAVNYGKSIVQPLLHPIDTVTGLVKTAAGGVEKLLPESVLPAGKTNEKHFDALVDFFKQRYGSVDALKRTIENDPVGFAGDISTVLAGGGAALKAGGLTKTGAVVSKAAQVTEPLNAALVPARAGVKALASSKVPEKMYMSAVKPQYTKKKGLERFKEEARVGLQEGIMPNEGGLEKLKGKVSEIEGVVEEAAQSMPGQSVIPMNKALQHVPEVIDKYSAGHLPQTSKKIINETVRNFVEENPMNFTLEEALAKKKSIYATEKAGYGVGVKPNEAVDTWKAIARGLKDSMYEAVLTTHPELKALGQKEGALLGLQGAIEQGALRIAKRDIMGIGLPIKTGIGTAVGSAVGSPAIGTIVGIAAGIMDTPTVKARLAIALKTAEKRKLLGKYGTARLGAYQAGRTGEIASQED